MWGSRARWIVDLRDPWFDATAGRQDHLVGESVTGRAVLRRMERFVLDRCDGLVVNSRELRDTLCAMYPNKRIEWIPNGVDLERLPASADPPFPGLSLAHVGTLYVNRDLGPVLRAFRTFLDAHPEARSAGSALRVAGRVEGAYADAFHRAVAELELQDVVEYLGMVPPADALRLLARSSLAIVLAQGQAYQIPAKLYESLGLGVPTLVVSEQDSATTREAERVGAHAAAPEDVSQMARLLAALWRDSAGRRSVSEAVDYRTIARQADAVLANF